MNPLYLNLRSTLSFAFGLLPLLYCNPLEGQQPALTVYNQNFAVVRDHVALDLKAGVNSVAFTETTVHLEPDSVVLRDPTGKRSLQILEQNFRADPVSQELLLNLYEGKVIQFIIENHGSREIINGKIIRSGYVPHQAAYQRYGNQYAMRQQGYASPGGGIGQPIIEINGQIRFGLPGQPLFPRLGDDSILKPTLQWLIQSDQPGSVRAELSYITGGMSWNADYNLIGAESGSEMDLVGWVTIDNQSGKSFEDARIKLMAGDISKVQPGQSPVLARRYGLADESTARSQQGVAQQQFDDYHLYTLERSTTLRDRETKQVEFVRAANIKSDRIYVYDGAKIPIDQYRGYSFENIRHNPEYGTQSNPKVWVMREFANTVQNKLGMPLPAGRVRFYKRDSGEALEFIGENNIDHTPKNETVRVFTGNAFDLVGERRRTDYKVDHARRTATESFEISVRNRKEEAVEIRVVEHLYRGLSWEIPEKSNTFLKTESQTVEFRIQVKPDEEKKITYTASYTW